MMVTLVLVLVLVLVLHINNVDDNEETQSIGVKNTPEVVQDVVTTHN